jgi:hypothetical protein
MDYIKYFLFWKTLGEFKRKSNEATKCDDF